MNVFIKNLASHVGMEITLRGWVSNTRSSGSIFFIELRDGSGFIQAVVSKEAVGGEVWANAEKLTQESSVILTGTVSQHPKKQNVFELQVKGIDIIQIADEYPIAHKEHGP